MYKYYYLTVPNCIPVILTAFNVAICLVLYLCVNILSNKLTKFNLVILFLECCAWAELQNMV